MTDLSMITALAQTARQQSQTVVLVTGVFDILHEEHQLFLQKAKAAGDLLLVGIECDSRVTAMKGPERPVNSQAKRQQALEALDIADHVFILPENFGEVAARRQLIHDLKPTILAVSSHSPHLDAKQKMMAEVGGVVQVVHEHNPLVSTTLLLEKTNA